MRKTAWLLALALSTVLAGCAGPTARTARAPRPHAGGSLSIALVGAPGSIDPLLAANESAVDLDELIYDGLVRVSPGQTPLPDLAKSWSVSSNGLVWTFLLAKARWQDGVAVTAQDVAFSLHAYMNPANGSAAAPLLSDIAAIRTARPRVVQVTLRKPDAAFLLDGGSLPILPWHLLHGLRPGRAFLSSPYLGARAIGTGPFRLVSARAGRFILAANRHYFLGSPLLQELRLQVYSAPAAALNALRTGRADLSPVPPIDAPAVGTWQKVRLAAVTGTGYLMLAFNFADTLFSSPALRRALVYAANRPAIMRASVGSYGVVAQGTLPKGSWAFDTQLPQIPYSPGTARAQLAAAGWKSRGGPFVVDRTGRPLRFPILVDSASPTRVIAARMLAQDLRATGVDASVQVVPFDIYVSRLVQGDFAAAMIKRGIGPDPDPSAYYLASPGVGAEANFSAYGDRTVDSAIESELSATTMAARQAAFDTMQQAMQMNPPGIFLYYGDNVDALGGRFGGFTANGHVDFFQPYRWYERGAP